MPKTAADLACENMLSSLLTLLRDSPDQPRYVPQERQELKEYIQMTATALNNLGLYHEVLLRRVLGGEATLTQDSTDPDQRNLILGNSDELDRNLNEVSDIQAALDDALASLNSQLGYLDEESMKRLPREDKDVGRFLALCLALEAELAWYLEVELLGRLWPEKPPAGAFTEC